jgi:hypothetical protein
MMGAPDHSQPSLVELILAIGNFSTVTRVFQKAIELKAFS